MRLISSDSIVINSKEKEPSKKFPELVGNVKTMILQKENSVYVVTIKYSYASNWIVLDIQDQDENYLQRNTYVASYPINLNLNLLGYGLFFQNNKFFWVELDDDYYSLNKTEEELLQTYKIPLEVQLNESI